MSRMAASSGGPSAAQNGTVIQTCPHCGAVNEGQEESCSFCDSRLAPHSEFSLRQEVSPAGPTALRPRSEGALALSREPVRGLDDADWRREVASRLEAYRSRRGKRPADGLQAALSFEMEPNVEEETPELTAEASERETRLERMEIDITQPAETEGPVEESEAWQREESPGEGALRKVADLGERRRAGLLDAAFLMLAYGGFLGVFKAFGGALEFGKADAVVQGVAMGAFYAQYFTLFTVLGRGTPGMLIRGLEVVSFDGGAPTRAQLAWRSFGYIVSAATGFLGYCWALWDVDGLTWQDRISQTYITPVVEQGFEVETQAGEEVNSL